MHSVRDSATIGGDIATSELLTTRATRQQILSETYLAVQPGLDLGQFRWRADDGQSLTTVSGAITLRCVGEPSQGNIPSEMAFLTSSDTSIQERMTITSDGRVGVGQPSPITDLHVQGSSIITSSLVVGTTSMGTGSATLQVSGTIDASDGMYIAGQPLVAYFMPYSGGIFTGPITLPSTNPTDNNHATRKAYVDAQISQNIVNHTHPVSQITSGVLPIARGGLGRDSVPAGHVLFGNGEQAVASSANLVWNNAEQRLGVNVLVPQSTLDVDGDARFSGSIYMGTQNVDDRFLLRTGGEMLSAITLPETHPTQPRQAAHKAYVDAQMNTRSPVGHTHDINTLTGVLSVDAGGTGTTTMPAAKILIGGGTQIVSDSALHWNATEKRLGVNTASPDYTLDVQGAINCTELIINNVPFAGDFLPRAGGTMTGQIVLPEALATQDRHATSKAYVDAQRDTRSPLGHTHDAANVTSGIFGVVRGGTGHDTLPQRSILVGNGSASITTPELFVWNNADRRLGVNLSNPLHTLDVDGDINVSGRFLVGGDELTDLFVAESGGVMTGFLTLHSDPTENDHASTKRYVDTGLQTRSEVGHTHSTGDILTGVLPTSRGGTGVGEVSAGRILFGGGTSPAPMQSSGSFRWIAASSRLGVNVANPGHTLDVGGDVNYSGTLRKNGSDIFATFVPAAGGEFTGSVRLPRMGVGRNADTNFAIVTQGDININSGTLRVNGNDMLTNAVQRSGAVMTGFLSLHAAPTQNMHAATKQYVDSLISGRAPENHQHNASHITSGVLAVTRGGTNAGSLTGSKVVVSNAAGTAMVTPGGLHWDAQNERLGVGTSTPARRLDVSGRVNSTDGYEQGGESLDLRYVMRSGAFMTGSLGVGKTGPASSAYALDVEGDVNLTGVLHVNGQPFTGEFVPLSGGTMSGFLTLHTSNPSNALHAASKGYVDARVATRAESVHTHPSSQITGVFGLANGGIGVTAVEPGRILFGGAVGATSLSSSPSLSWNASTGRLVVQGDISFTGNVMRNSQVWDPLMLTTGGTVTGEVTFNGAVIHAQQLTLPSSNPTSNNHATRKGYVDNLINTHVHGANDITSGVLGVARGGTGSSSFVAGRVVVGGASGNNIISSNDLHWNQSSRRLGVNNTNPSATLHVGGDAIFSGRVRINQGSGALASDNAITRGDLDTRLESFVAKDTAIDVSSGLNIGSVPFLASPFQTQVVAAGGTGNAATFGVFVFNGNANISNGFTAGQLIWMRGVPSGNTRVSGAFRVGIMSQGNFDIGQQFLQFRWTGNAWTPHEGASWSDGANGNIVRSFGNVGIGLSDPTHRLDVSGTSRFAGAVTFTQNVTSNATLTASNVRVTGNVGIDVANPLSPLHVNGAVRANEFLEDGQTLFDRYMQRQSLHTHSISLGFSSNDTQLIQLPISNMPTTFVKFSIRLVYEGVGGNGSNSQKLENWYSVQQWSSDATMTLLRSQKERNPRAFGRIVGGGGHATAAITFLLRPVSAFDTVVVGRVWIEVFANKNVGTFGTPTISTTSNDPFDENAPVSTGTSTVGGRLGVGTNAPLGDLSIVDTPGNNARYERHIMFSKDRDQAQAGWDWYPYLLGKGMVMVADGAVRCFGDGANIISSGIAFNGRNLNFLTRDRSTTDTSEDLQLADVSRMVIDAQGNVGIGVMSPRNGMRFDVWGPTIISNDSNVPLLYLAGNGGPGGVQGRCGIRFSHWTPLTLESSNEGQYPGELVFEQLGTTGRRGNFKFRAQTGTNAGDPLEDVMVVSGNGRVGIGRTSPDEKLDVDGNILNRGYLSLSNSAGGWIDGQYNAMVYALHSSSGISGSSSLVLQAGGTHTNRHIYLRTRNETRMTILNDGRVGVGGANPSARFEIVGRQTTSAITDTSPHSSYSQVIYSNDGNSGELCGLAFTVYSGNTPNDDGTGSSGINSTPGCAITHERIGGFSRGHMHFRTRNGQSSDSSCPIRMTIRSNGNVGIGTTSPNTTLHVAGGSCFGNASSSQSSRHFFTHNDTSVAPNAICVEITTPESGNHRVPLFLCRKTTDNGHHLQEWHSDWGATNQQQAVMLSNGRLSLRNGVHAMSDDRVKFGEAFIENATETLLKLRPQIYYKAWFGANVVNGRAISVGPDGEETSQEVPLESGLIAQEVFYDAPELRHLVSVPDDAVGVEEPPEDYYAHRDDPTQDPDWSNWGSTEASLNYVGLVPYLIRSLQEMHQRVTALETELATLRRQH